MKLGKKLSSKQFLLSHLAILVFSLTFLLALHFIVNIQYQKSNKPLSYGPVTTAPKSLRLDLVTPEDDSLFFQPTTLVSGKGGPSSNILISTGSRDLVIKSKADGSFSTDLSLIEGVNNITVVVFDATGDFRSAERTIYYSKEKI